MGRDDKVGFKRGNAKRKVRSKDQGSDESDEDFTIGEGEELESDEYCSSLDPDESEEPSLEFELDEEEEEEEEEEEGEEEEVTTKVKRAARSKTRKTVSAKRRKRSKKKPKKKYRFSYKKDEDDDDEFVEDDDDVEFIPDEIDYVDREDETPVVKKRRVSYREEEEEEDNDDDGDDDYNNEDEKDEDDDNEVEDDGEFTLDAIDFVDEEDDMLLLNKDKNVRNLNSRERGIAKGRKRRRSSDVMKKSTSTLRKPRTKHRLVRKTRSGSVPRLARKSSSGTVGEFANKSLMVEDRRKNIPVRRRKYVAPSDSDFMSHVSSDDEYITSEKEREHHRMEGKTSPGIARIARLPRKRSAATEREFANKNLMGEGRSKKTTVRRRKLVQSSDSDFISPASDYDYTISEEEREQVREADKFCNSLNTNSRSMTSSKKCEEEAICKQRKRPERKGKEKLEDLNKVVKQVCGICLSEEGKRTIRGTLNSCSHFFCFACIMEWSKVESRCPLCKQRFATISKPARSDSGFDLRTVVIQVPERDQVYQPSEEELRGFLDPYDGVICTECQQGGDDALMLLCDICDSPAHTYCVGLGRDVPEGNWYCEGCRPAASGAPSPHGLNHALDHRASNFLSSLSSPVHNVGVLDLNSLYVPDTPMTQQNGPFPIPRRFGSEFHVASPTSGSGVFTVHDRRRIRQIHHLLNTRRNPSRIQPNEMPSTTSGIRLFGSQIDGGTGLAIQRTVTPEMRTLEYTSHHGRLHDNTNTFLSNRDASSSRSFMRSEQIQNSEHGGIGMVFNSRLAYEQLHPCNSRSNNDSGDPSHTFRETTIRSRTSQESLRGPF